MVARRNEIETQFDFRGYTRGAEMMATIEDELGREDFVGFLRDFHAERAFEPFTTDAFVEALVAHTDDARWRETFERWVNQPR